MGVSEIEFLGSGPEDDDEPDSEQTAGSEPGSPSEVVAGAESAAAADPRSTFRRTPVLALMAVLLLAIAAAGTYALVRQDRTGEDFSLTLVSAQYTLPQDASGIDLAIALQNTGPTMVELTGVSLYQPGLVRETQTGDVVGATETEAGASTTSALGPGTAIAPLAMAPKDVDIVTVPYRYDCNLSSDPPVTRAFSVTGFNARGGSRTAKLTLAQNVTPWEVGSIMRTAVCGLPSPEADLKVAYGGIGNTLMELTPVRFNYSILLTAPADTTITVSSISQNNPGIAGSVDPGLPVQVLDGQTVRLTVSWRVMSCVIATSVHSGDGVVITASSHQTVQTWQAALGAQFTKDLDAEISTVCSGT